MRENITVKNNTELTENSKTIRFAVMPFVDNHNYQYNYDIVQEAVILSLWQKGYHPIYYPNMKDSIEQKLNLNLFYLNDKQAQKVAEFLDVDILIFGRAEFGDNLIFSRSFGLNRTRYISRQIIIKALDSSTAEIILRERLNSRVDWGLYHGYKNIRTMVMDYINQLKHLGYIK